MPFLSHQHPRIPTKDITSWLFCHNPEIKDSNDPVLIDCSTHSTAKSTVRKLIAGLRARGLQKGQCVCVHSFNDIDYPILVNGIIGAGGVWAGSNPSYTSCELVHAITVARISFFIVEPALLRNVLEAAQQVDLPRDHIFIFDHGSKQNIPMAFSSWRELLEHGEQDWESFDDEHRSRNTTVAHCFSSGTTGLPKAAVVSHYNLIAQHCLLKLTKKEYQERRLVSMPLYHMAVIPTVHFSALRSGSKVFLMRRFVLKQFLRNIARHQISELVLVPPMVMDIINNSSLLKDSQYSLKSIQHGIVGAAPLRQGPQKRFKALLGEGVPFAQVWAMTETTCFATTFPYPLDDATASVGYPLPGIDLKLVDDAGNDISKPETRGEICIRGPTVIRGYLDPSTSLDPNEPAHEKIISADWDSDGFFHTGDIAYMKGPDAGEHAGKWYIVDRKKELIKVRGFQVAPPELENVLLGHPLIVDAVVVGTEALDNRGESATELPRAYVVRSSPSLGAEEVKIYLAQRLAKYKRLEGGVVFIDRIPRNASGKIMKRFLREQAARELSKERSDGKARM